MNYVRQEINFRKVVAGDTFDPALVIGDEYPITPETTVVMAVRPYGDIPQPPIITFQTGESITIEGQKLKFYKHGGYMFIRPGKYKYDCEFTQNEAVTTLFGGLFEVIPKSSQPTN